MTTGHKWNTRLFSCNSILKEIRYKPVEKIRKEKKKKNPSLLGVELECCMY